VSPAKSSVENPATWALVQAATCAVVAPSMKLLTAMMIPNPEFLLLIYGLLASPLPSNLQNLTMDVKH
jgi:hypothetical protein